MAQTVQFAGQPVIALVPVVPARMFQAVQLLLHGLKVLAEFLVPGHLGGESLLQCRSLLSLPVLRRRLRQENAREHRCDDGQQRQGESSTRQHDEFNTAGPKPCRGAKPCDSVPSAVFRHFRFLLSEFQLFPCIWDCVFGRPCHHLPTAKPCQDRRHPPKAKWNHSRTHRGKTAWIGRWLCG